MQGQAVKDNLLKDQFTSLSGKDKLSRREDFAVSLRNKKRKAIINEKRNRTYDTILNKSLCPTADKLEDASKLLPTFMSLQSDLSAILHTVEVNSG